MYKILKEYILKQYASKKKKSHVPFGAHTARHLQQKPPGVTQLTGASKTQLLFPK